MRERNGRRNKESRNQITATIEEIATDRLTDEEWHVIYREHHLIGPRRYVAPLLYVFLSSFLHVRFNHLVAVSTSLSHRK